MPSPPYEIVNIVLTAQLSGPSIDLDEIAANFDGRTIERPPCAHVRYRGVGLVFHPRAGVTVTGARSIQQATSVLRQLLTEAYRVSAITTRARIRKTRVDNIAASADLGHPVDLDVFAASIDGCTYDPTHVSALTFRIPGSKTVCQVHGTGRVIVLGAKSEEQIQCALNALIAGLNEVDMSDGGKGAD